MVEEQVRQWLQASGAMMVGFFILNFWIKWLRTRNGVHPFVLRTPIVVVVLLLAIEGWIAFLYWEAWQKVKLRPAWEKTAYVTERLDLAKEIMPWTFAVVLLGVIVLLIASVRSTKQPSFLERSRKARERRKERDEQAHTEENSNGELSADGSTEDRAAVESAAAEAVMNSDENSDAAEIAAVSVDTASS